MLLRFANGAQGITVSVDAGPNKSEVTVGAKLLRLDSQERLWGVKGNDLHGGDWQLPRPTMRMRPMRFRPTNLCWQLPSGARSPTPAR